MMPRFNKATQRLEKDIQQWLFDNEPFFSYLVQMRKETVKDIETLRQSLKGLLTTGR